MFEFLRHIWVIQIRRLNYKGSYFFCYRLNPYNPLSYPILLILCLYMFIDVLFSNTWKTVEVYNPFEWTLL